VANEALRAAMAAAQHSNASLGAAIDVDPKTIQRWRSQGRIPHAGTANRAAVALGVDVGTLWPSLTERSAFASTAEVAGFYPHRSMVPTSVWRDLVDRATQRIWVLTYASAFLPEAAPEAIHSIAAKAAAGCDVRLALGDPDCEQVAIRTHEEGIPIDDRIRMALAYYSPLLGQPGVQFRLHQTVLYNTIVVLDDDMLINQFALGVRGFEAPILHLRVAGGTLFDLYLRSFEQAWAESWPYEPTSTGPNARTASIAANAA
jgi:hypothetical protein